MEVTSRTYECAYTCMHAHAVDREQYSQMHVNSSLRLTRGRFLPANAIVICALDLKLSGCTIIIMKGTKVQTLCNLTENHNIWTEKSLYVLGEHSSQLNCCYSFLSKPRLVAMVLGCNSNNLWFL